MEDGQPRASSLMQGAVLHTHMLPGLGAHTSSVTHLLSGGMLHRNPVAFSSHLEEGRQQGREGATDWEGKGGRQEEGCMDTFEKPRDQFVNDILEGFVRSGKKNIQGPVSNHLTLISPDRDPTSHLLSLDSGPSTGVLVD